jgi:hypothetical protein
MFTNSIQMWNLLKVINNNRTLIGLKSINDVYENAVNIDEEIYLYHLNKDQLNSKNNTTTKSEMSLSKMSEVIELEDINSVSNKLNIS